MQKLIARFFADESGATAVEYALIAASVAAVLVTAMGTLGPAITGAFTTIAGDLG